MILLTIEQYRPDASDRDIIVQLSITERDSLAYALWASKRMNA